MSRKAYNIKRFTLPGDYTIDCWTENTNYGFRHLCELKRDYNTIAKSKACYYNRTWESYCYQSVIKSVLSKYFGDDISGIYEHNIHKDETARIEQEFKFIGAIAQLGNIFCNNVEDKNKWKQRMLKAGLKGLDFPEEFNTLSEEEKERRLNKVIDFTTNKIH